MKASLAALALAVAGTLAAASAPADTVAIRAGGVIDTVHGSVAKDQVIVVENGKISAVGTGVPSGATVIDLSHEWVAPGLIDAHTHMTLTEIVGGDAPFKQRGSIAPNLYADLVAMPANPLDDIEALRKSIS